MKFLIGYLSIYLAFGANAFADDTMDQLITNCNATIPKAFPKMLQTPGIESRNSRCNANMNAANDQILLSSPSNRFGKTKCNVTYSLMNNSIEELNHRQSTNCNSIKTKYDLVQSYQGQDSYQTQASSLRAEASSNADTMVSLSFSKYNDVKKAALDNIKIAKSDTKYGRELKAANQNYDSIVQNIEKQLVTENYSDIPASGISGLRSNSLNASVAKEQIQAAADAIDYLKRNKLLIQDFTNQKKALTGDTPPPNTNGDGKGSDGNTTGSGDGSGISGLVNPNTLMGLASIGASLAPMFMQQSQQQKKQKTPKEKPETQSSSLSSVGKPNNGVGFSQPTAPEVKTTTGENPATPNSAEFNSAKSDISDKSTPLTTAGGGGSSSSTSKPSDAAGGAGASGALAAKNEKKEEAPKPQSSATDDTLGGLGGGGAGALGYSPPPDHESPLKDILPTDAPVAEGENTDAVIGNGEMENGAREVASEEDQIKSPESLFFRVRGTLSRCQKKGCVSSTAGNAAKNLPF